MAEDNPDVEEKKVEEKKEEANVDPDAAASGGGAPVVITPQTKTKASVQIISPIVMKITGVPEIDITECSRATLLKLIPVLKGMTKPFLKQKNHPLYLETLAIHRLNGTDNLRTGMLRDIIIVICKKWYERSSKQFSIKTGDNETITINIASSVHNNHNGSKAPPMKESEVEVSAANDIPIVVRKANQMGLGVLKSKDSYENTLLIIAQSYLKHYPEDAKTYITNLSDQASKLPAVVASGVTPVNPSS